MAWESTEILQKEENKRWKDLPSALTNKKHVATVINISRIILSKLMIKRQTLGLINDRNGTIWWWIPMLFPAQRGLSNVVVDSSHRLQFLIYEFLRYNSTYSDQNHDWKDKVFYQKIFDKTNDHKQNSIKLLLTTLSLLCLVLAINVHDKTRRSTRVKQNIPAKRNKSMCWNNNNTSGLRPNKKDGDKYEKMFTLICSLENWRISLIFWIILAEQSSFSNNHHYCGSVHRGRSVVKIKISSLIHAQCPQCPSKIPSNHKYVTYLEKFGALFSTIKCLIMLWRLR